MKFKYCKNCRYTNTNVCKECNKQNDRFTYKFDRGLCVDELECPYCNKENAFDTIDSFDKDAQYFVECLHCKCTSELEIEYTVKTIKNDKMIVCDDCNTLLSIDNFKHPENDFKQCIMCERMNK